MSHAAELQSLAKRFRRIDAATNAQGQFYVQRLGATAAQLAKSYSESTSVAWPHLRPGSLPTAMDVSSWYKAWCDLCFELQQLYGRRLPLDLGVRNWKNHGTKEVPTYTEHPSEQDWRERAEDFAAACELLAELIETESSKDQPTRHSPDFAKAQAGCETDTAFRQVKDIEKRYGINGRSGAFRAALKRLRAKAADAFREVPRVGNDSRYEWRPAHPEVTSLIQKYRDPP